MITKSSQALKAELRTNFYGINPASLLVECVDFTGGGMLTHWLTGASPRTFRIKGGKAALVEIERVFRLTDIVAIAASKDPFPGHPDHPVVAALELLAASRRRSTRRGQGSGAATSLINCDSHAGPCNTDWNLDG